VSERFDQLAARHRALRAHSALQRDSLGRTARDIEARLGVIDRRVAALRGVLRHPAVLAGGVAIVALIGPKRLLRWVSRGALMYTTASRLRRLP
jgi:hypothetical protein